MIKTTPNYWLFQFNPKVFRLKDALRAEALRSANVKAHKSKIKSGDQVILWQAGKNAGCYALATVISDVQEIELLEGEKSYYETEQELTERVFLNIDLIGNLAKSGNWFFDSKQDHTILEIDDMGFFGQMMILYIFSLCIGTSF